MDTMKVIFRVPADYNDHFGSYAPTHDELELLDKMIAARLPKNVDWTGDEIIAHIDSEFQEQEEQDFAEIWEAAVSNAYDEFFG